MFMMLQILDCLRYYFYIACEAKAYILESKKDILRENIPIHLLKIFHATSGIY